MRKEIKTLVYDEELRLEAYRFEGNVQSPFPIISTTITSSDS